MIVAFTCTQFYLHYLGVYWTYYLCCPDPFTWTVWKSKPKNTAGCCFQWPTAIQKCGRPDFSPCSIQRQTFVCLIHGKTTVFDHWQLLILSIFHSLSYWQGLLYSAILFHVGYDPESHWKPHVQCLPLVPCPLPQILVKDPERRVTFLFCGMMIKAELV